MSKKSQHNNILLAVIGFTAVVILVGVIGFFTLEQKDDTIQGEVEVSEYRVSCKLPGRVVELRVQEGDYVHVGDTLAILEVPAIVRTDFWIPTILLGQSKEILYLEVETQLRESLPSDELLEIITQSEVLQTDIVSILEIKV